ncbi:unnamed protein product [Cylicostephanus goldi]|uniref:BEN domain-containing protein n=1 Tax=Cylicostephanus goldi TaxID=71465 RepID=A0A3P6QCI4_CYLGO|nr:unnamed protein product [Cylicostephanus goldi]
MWAAVYFTRTKTSDVVPMTDVIGEPLVGRLTKAKWYGKTYMAKIMCIGDRETCENKLPLITEEGEVQNPAFSRCTGTTLENNSLVASTERQMLERLTSSVGEINAKLDRIESEMGTRALQLEAVQQRQRLLGVGVETRTNSQEILKRTPRRIDSEGELAYDYASRPFLEGLRKLAGGNVNKFALDLEKEVYASNTTELTLPVEKRVTTATRVSFIKECIYKYYMVPVETRQSVWKAAKAALDSRVRRLRCSAGTTPSRSAAVFEFEEEMDD